MVKKFFSLFQKEFSNVNEAALLLAAFSLISQLLGLLRDRSLAHVLGPSETLDIYYAAFRIPDFLYVSIASLASISVLLPFLSRYIAQDASAGEERARVFMNTVFTVFFAVLAVLGVILFFSLPILVAYLTPGFNAHAQGELIRVSRIMLLSPIIFGISNMYGSITQLYRKFFVYALAPVFYNLGIILGIFFLYPKMGLLGLGVGVVGGAVMHFLIQLPVLIRHKFLPRFISKIDFHSIREVTTLSIPRTLGLSLSQLSMLILVALMSRLYVGSISIFTLSYNLETVPTMLIGISYAVAAFPVLVSSFEKGDHGVFVDRTLSVVRSVMFWSFPIMSLLIVLRAQVVRVVLGSGSFSWSDTRLTAAALAVFMFSVVAQCLIHVLVRAFYAARNTRLPLVINIASALITICSAWWFVHIFNSTPSFRYFFESLFRVNDIPGTEILMIPLAYSFGTIINAIFLWGFFVRRFKPRGARLVGRTFFESCAAACMIGVVTYEMLQIFSRIFSLSTFFGIFLQGFCAGSIGIMIGIGVLHLMGSVELKDFFNTIRHKFWQTTVVAPESQEL